MRRVVTAIGALVVAGAAAARALRGWSPVRVAGESMAPTLRPGDVLAVRPLRDDEPTIGEVVVWRSVERESVKRVVEPPRPIPSGTVWLEGDNADASTDSRSIGPVPRSQLVAVVRARYRPVRRARLF